MHPKLPDILANRDAPIDNEQLIQYLKGDLDDANRHAIEEKLTEGNQMEEDAWEGWQQSAEPVKMIQAAEEINRSLMRQLHQPAPRKRKRPITQLPVVWWVFGLILIIVLLAWVIISLSA
jgi:anti-sigma factor RsiW